MTWNNANTLRRDSSYREVAFAVRYLGPGLMLLALEAMAMRSLLPRFGHRSTTSLTSAVKVSSVIQKRLSLPTLTFVVKRETSLSQIATRGNIATCDRSPSTSSGLVKSETLEHLYEGFQHRRLARMPGTTLARSPRYLLP